MAEKILVEFQAAGLDGLTADLAQASGATETLNTQTTSLRAELRRMQQSLAQLALAGKENTAEYKKLRDEAGKLRDAISDAANEIKTAGSDTRGLDKALRATNVLVGGFTALQGATALFGKESENLQKTLLKVNAAMAILSGLQAIQEELTRKDSIITAAAAKAKELYARVTTTATIATRAFVAVLSGGLLVALGLLVANWDKVTAALSRNKKKLEEIKEAQDELKASQDAQLQRLQTQEKILKAQGVSEDKILQARIDKARQFQQENSKLILQLQAQRREIEKGQQAVTTQGFRQSAASAAKQTKELNDRIAELQAANFNLEADIVSATAEIKNQTQAQNDLSKATDGATAAIERQRQSSRDSTYEGKKGRDQEVQDLESIEAATVSIVDAEDEKLKKMKEVAQQSLATHNNIKSQAEIEAERLERVLELAGEIQQRLYLFNQAAAAATDIAATAIDNRSQKRIQALEAERAAGVIGEKAYQQQLAKIQNDAARKKRKAEIAQAIANIPQAALSAFTNTTGGIIAKSIAAAFATAFAIAKVAQLRRAPLPQFRHGVIDLQGPGTATSDSITARLSKGESVMTAEETQRHKAALMAMRKKTFDKVYIPVDEVIKKHRPMTIPTAPVVTPKAEENSQMLHKIYEELVYNNHYTKEGNRIGYKSKDQLAAIKKGLRHGIRV